MDKDQSISRRHLLAGGMAVAVSAALPAELLASAGAPYRLTKTEIEIFPRLAPAGFSHFRIPSIVRTPSDQLFVFCEGRYHLQDWGDTDIIARTSLDGGQTWRDLNCSVDQTAIQSADADQSAICRLVGDRKLGLPNPIGTHANWRNPTAVYAAGRMYMFVVVDQDGEWQKAVQSGRSKHSSRLFVLRTINPEKEWAQRLMWSHPQEIRVPLDVRFAQFGPGRAIYNNGRIIIPAAAGGQSFCLLSDDLGETFYMSKPAGRATEHQVAVLRDNRLLMSKRAPTTQRFFVSKDNGNTWKRRRTNKTLTTPTVQTGLFVDHEQRVLVTSPNHSKDRVDISLFYQQAGALNKPWSAPIPLEPDNRCRRKLFCRNLQGYSVIEQLSDKRIIVIYEDAKHGFRNRRINCAILEPR